ncbi:DUF6778 family protein [Arenibacterium sp. CAU 1754]
MVTTSLQFAPSAGVRILKAALAAFAAVFFLAACAVTWAVDYGAPLDPAVTRTLRVSSVRVSVPDTLTVSNQNSFTPDADIVWHGDPPGDRRAQVRAIVDTAAKRAVAPLRGGRNAVLNIVVTEFHGVTPKTRARAPGAVHNISFIAQLVDARTGTELTPATPMRADLSALVGSSAIAAAEQGITQKSRVTQHLEAVLKGWLGIGPDIRGTFRNYGR